MIENPWLRKGREYFSVDMVCVNEECDEYKQPITVDGYTETDTGADVIEDDCCTKCGEGLEYH